MAQIDLATARRFSQALAIKKVMNKVRDYNPENQSVLGRLLEELSWVGKTINTFREGGRGFENVLTAEVFQALDFLPRTTFLGKIIAASEGANKTREILIKEIEDAEFSLLPGNHYLIPSGERHQTKLPVQPDGLIETQNVYVVLEAKRIRQSSFQPEQLAREYVLSLREAGDRTPLLLLVLGKEPPISVQKHGRKSIKESIEMFLKSVLDRAENHSLSEEYALSKIDDVVCWVTWEKIKDVVQTEIESIETDSQSIKNSITRVARSACNSIEWHK